MPCQTVEFEEFPDHQATIWKYMDLPKFAALLDEESLYFTQVSRFEDPFEGSLPQENLKYREFRKGKDKEKESVGQYRNLLNRELAKYIYVDCWHKNEGESAAMWDLYTTKGYGIAITSTVGQYLNAISEHTSEGYAGAVNYINYREDSIPRYNTLAPVFHKRRSFEHEKEFRGVIQELPYFLKAAEFHKDPEILESDIERFEPDPVAGRYISVNVGEFVNQIYVAPDTPSWQKSVIETITESLSELNCDDVTRSSLEEDPVY